jgi:DNA repair protein RadC
VTAPDLAAILADLLEGTRAATGAADLAAAGLPALVREAEAGELPDEAARRLQAAFELGRLLLTDTGPARPELPDPGTVARFLLPRHSHAAVELFGVLSLDARHRLIREDLISKGCLTASLVHPREVFACALATRANALVLFHNHPSGDPEPSAEDIALTRRLAAAGSLMGIEVLDHLVLGHGRFVSLKSRGLV